MFTSFDPQSRRPGISTTPGAGGDRWASIANQILMTGGNPGTAGRFADAGVRESILRRIKANHVKMNRGIT